MEPVAGLVLPGVDGDEVAGATDVVLPASSGSGTLLDTVGTWPGIKEDQAIVRLDSAGELVAHE